MPVSAQSKEAFLLHSAAANWELLQLIDKKGGRDAHLERKADATLIIYLKQVRKFNGKAIGNRVEKSKR